MMNNQKQIRKWVPAFGIVVITGALMAFSSQQHPNKQNGINDTENKSEAVSNDSIYDKVDKMPEFPGGQKAMFKYFGEKIDYPKKAMKDEVEGKTFVSFVVDKTGKIRDVKVLRTNHEVFRAPSKKVIQNMPDWSPGEKDGNKVYAFSMN